MESRESKILYTMNKEYLELFYSNDYQKVMKIKKIKQLIKEKQWMEILQIVKGRFLFKKLVNSNFKINDNSFIEDQCETKLENCRSLNKKIVVYTCIVGNYDSIKEPFFINPEIDYIIFTDQDVPKSSAWKKIDITKFKEYYAMSPTLFNRLVKMKPHLFLKEYDYSIYIDGTITVISDMAPIIEKMDGKIIGVHKHAYRDCIYMERDAILYSKRANKKLINRQIKEYEKENYPKHNGLYENTILVREHNENNCIRVMEEWWREYLKYPTRDQISFPYILWKERIKKKNVLILGNNLNLNPRFRRNLSHNE